MRLLRQAKEYIIFLPMSMGNQNSGRNIISSIYTIILFFYYSRHCLCIHFLSKMKKGRNINRRSSTKASLQTKRQDDTNMSMPFL